MDRAQWQFKGSKKKYPIGKVVTDKDEVYVLNFSDLHVGHPNCRYELIKRAVGWAQEKEALCIFGGDWMENSTKVSVGAGWLEQKLGPEKQKKWLLKTFEPIKDQFIGGYIGNHEARTYGLTGHDPAEDLCEKLDMPYYGTEMFVMIASEPDEHRNNRTHTLYGTHSGSGHKSSGLAIGHMQRDWSFVQADIKMKSHDHQLDYDTETVLRFNRNPLGVDTHLQHLVLTGSTLDRPNSYATKKPHTPTRLGFMPIVLNMRSRNLAEGKAWSVRPVYELAEG